MPDLQQILNNGRALYLPGQIPSHRLLRNLILLKSGRVYCTVCKYFFH